MPYSVMLRHRALEFSEMLPIIISSYDTKMNSERKSFESFIISTCFVLYFNCCFDLHLPTIKKVIKSKGIDTPNKPRFEFYKQ